MGRDQSFKGKIQAIRSDSLRQILRQLRTSQTRLNNKIGSSKNKSQIDIGEMDELSFRPGPRHQPALRHVTESIGSMRVVNDKQSIPPLKSSRSNFRLSIEGSPVTSTTNESQRTGVSTHSLRKTRGLQDLRSNMDTQSILSDGTSTSQSPYPDETASFTTNVSHGTFASVLSVVHFQSFCVLDTQVSGSPVTATTDDLRYSMRIGGQFKLIIEASESPWVDLVAGTGIDGKEVLYLVMFTPLISVGTGSRRFLLAALVDVTEFIQDAASEPEYDSRPSTSMTQGSSTHSSYQLKPDDLLGGCILPQDRADMAIASELLARDRSHRNSHRQPSPDIWLSLAEEDHRKTPRALRRMQHVDASRPASVSSSAPSMSGSRATISEGSTVVDDILADFMLGLQKLYANVFILSRTPLDDQYFEISSISPSVYASGEHVTGHMSMTPADSMTKFRQGIASGRKFRTVIRWGERGEKMQLYSVPLYGQQSLTWLNILVGMEMPLLW